MDEGLIDPNCIEPEELDEVEAAPRGEQLARFRQHHGPFEDIAKETRRWSNFSLNRLPDDFLPDIVFDEVFKPVEYVEPEPYIPPTPYIAPPKTGRNEPCPCGSGKKYKKCCGR